MDEPIVYIASFFWHCVISLLTQCHILSFTICCWSSPQLVLIQFSRSVVSDSLRPRGLQHASPPCPSPTPRAYSNSCPLSLWCPPAISFFVVPFSSHLQSFPASGSFQMSQLFASVGQSIGVSASASVLPMNTQNWFPLGWTGWISLGLAESPRDSQNHIARPPPPKKVRKRS